MRLMTVIKPDRKIAGLLAGLLLALTLTVAVFTEENREAVSYQSWVVANNSPVMEMPKRAFLTFDDGPTKVTAELLDVLKEVKVPATFFVVGKSTIETAERDALWKRMAKEGHTIGLHVYEHISYPKLYASGPAYYESVFKLEGEVKAVTGVQPTIYRFPAGSRNNYCSKEEYEEIVSVMSKKGYEYYDWTVDGQDAIGVHKSAASVANHVIKESKKLQTAVILLHDLPNCKGSIEAVPEIVASLKAAGYTFDTLDHLDETIHQTRP